MEETDRSFSPIKGHRFASHKILIQAWPRSSRGPTVIIIGGFIIPCHLPTLSTRPFSMRSFSVGSLRTRPLNARPFTAFYLPLPTCFSFKQRSIDCLVDSSLQFSRSYLDHIGSSNSASSTHHFPVVEKSINVSSNDDYL